MNALMIHPTRVVASRAGLGMAAIDRGYARLVHTSPVAEHEKTPIQVFGWEYLKKQEQTSRPLSPHLSIYKPQLTWYASGFHRISGCVMAGTLVIGGVGFALLPLDFTTFVQTIDGWHLPWIITDTFKFYIAYPIFFHIINGIRFMGFDLAKGMDIKTVYQTGWGVVALSAVLALLVVLQAKKSKQSRGIAKTK